VVLPRESKGRSRSIGPGYLGFLHARIGLKKKSSDDCVASRLGGAPIQTPDGFAFEMRGQALSPTCNVDKIDAARTNFYPLIRMLKDKIINKSDVANRAVVV
jgi:hypothetical protein